MTHTTEKVPALLHLWLKYILAAYLSYSEWNRIAHENVVLT